MTQTKVVCPILDDSKTFADWKKEVEFWQIATNIRPRQQAATVFLSLEGKSREAVLELPTAVVGAEDGSGFQAMMDKLDSLWKEDENLEAFNAYERFEQYKRPANMDVKEFIVAFERLNNRLVATGTVLPEGVLAYRLLKSAALTPEQEQLSKATVETFTFDAMCNKLKSIFGDLNKNSRQDGSSGIIRMEPKQEEAYIMEDAYYGHAARRGSFNEMKGREERGAGRGRGTYRDNRNDRNDRPGGRYMPERNDRQSQSGGPTQDRRYTGNTDTRRKTNPVDNYGQPSKCGNCGNIYHWRRECPEKRARTPFFTGFVNSSIQECYVSKLVGETLSSGILDCGCTKTVCGKDWYEDFVQNMTTEDKKCVQEARSEVPYKFGGNDIVSSYQCATIPVYVGNQRCTLETEVVDIDLPLLISKQAMKSTGMILDFNKDSATLNGEEISLDTTSSGHYALSLTRQRNQLVEMSTPGSSEQKPQKAFMAFDVSGRTAQEKKKSAIKLHRQFGHPSHEKLASLVKLSGSRDEEFMKALQETAERCETCKKYKKKNPRPVVGLSLSRDFNATIAMDLKQIQGKLILHMIDLATRFSQAAVVNNKRRETIVEAVLRFWVNTFGVPDRILTDNGGEFNNRDMQDMAENLNTEVMTTAAESPWSNGVCERHNAVIGQMVTKMMSDSDISLEMALAWAVNAKNSLHNVYGFSPSQLVFGRNPNLPSVLNDKIPALNGTTQSEEVARHLNAMHGARRAFVESEASTKIRRALRHNVREATTMTFEPGNRVYYKRIDSDYWRGPAVVIGKDSHQVILKHGGLFVRAHPTSLQKIEEEPDFRSSVVEESQPNCSTMVQSQSCHDNGADEEGMEEDGDEDGEDREHQSAQGNDLMSFDEGITPDDQNQSLPIEDSASESLLDDFPPTPGIPVPTSTPIREREEPNTSAVPGPTAHIRYRDKGTEDPWQEGIVINRGGKARGKHKMWMNVQLQPDGEHRCVNFDMVEWRTNPESAFISDSSTHNAAIARAMSAELNNLIENGVYEEINDDGQDHINTKWDFTEKTDGDSTWIKARLVAKGFQENTDDLRKDSPTCSKTNLRTVLAIAATNKWKVSSIDIKSAFLQGRQIEREVIVKPPKEAGKGKLWRLRKALYGLNDAAREWYLKVHETIAEMGGTRSTYDNAIFYWQKDDQLCGLCTTHVDDFILSGSPELLDDIEKEIHRRFKVGAHCEGKFTYIGIRVEQTDQGISLSQKSYVDGLEQMQSDCADAGNDAPLDQGGKQALKSLAGQLMWISSHTRPDAAYDVCDISTSVTNATQQDLLKTNKVIRKLKSDEVSIHYSNIGRIEDAEIVCYVDASYGNLKGGASQGAHIIFLKGKNGNFSPISWRSKKLKRIAKSTMAAEGQALGEGADESFAVQGFIRELHNGRAELPITIRTDNYNLAQTVYSTNQITDKRLQMDLAIIREMLEKKELARVEWVPGEMQLADCLTKKGASSRKLMLALSGRWKM